MGDTQVIKMQKTKQLEFPTFLFKKIKHLKYELNIRIFLSQYGPKVDVWAIGCVFVELINVKKEILSSLS